MDVDGFSLGGKGGENFVYHENNTILLFLTNHVTSCVMKISHDGG